MWKQPWSYKEGAAICCGLLLVGLALQLSIGSINWNLFAWPANLITIIIYVILCVGIYMFRQRVTLFKFMASAKAAVPAIIVAALLTVLMGLIRQAKNPNPHDPLGLQTMLSSWPFVLVYFWMTTIIAEETIKQIVRFNRYRVPSLLAHIGLFIALVAGTLGSADMQRLKMYCVEGQPEWRALDDAENIHELDLAIQLNKFILEEYEPEEVWVNSEGVVVPETKVVKGDSSFHKALTQPMPKRYASDVEIITKQGQNIKTTIDVNKPCTVNGYKIYQYSYDEAAGRDSKLSIFELVSDPWLPYAYTGMILLLVGAILFFFLKPHPSLPSRGGLTNKVIDKMYYKYSK